MTDRAPTAIERIEAIYARLPTIECQGLCWNSCGPIDMSPVERERIEAAGVEIPPYTSERGAAWAANIVAIGDERFDCPALTPMKRCSVYEIRPFICRAWGVGRGELACPYGCPMDGRRLRSTEILRMQNEVLYEGGGLTEEEKALADAVERDPGVTALYNRYIAGDRSVRPQLEAAIQRKADELGADDQVL